MGLKVKDHFSKRKTRFLHTFASKVWYVKKFKRKICISETIKTGKKSMLKAKKRFNCEQKQVEVELDYLEYILTPFVYISHHLLGSHNTRTT